ncbi:hypothetical protein [Angustibacter luteus]|uniref:Uncharacterized protein n=1 Tax=Angustibacter luteus TaxID=658456 RepID=A0ABW1JCE5_9ACTN
MSHGYQDQLCLELRSRDGRREFSGGCGFTDSSPRSETYGVFGGPGDDEFAYGPVSASVAAVVATRPGHPPVRITPIPISGFKQAAAAFVYRLPDHSAQWIFTGEDASGAQAKLGVR